MDARTYNVLGHWPIWLLVKTEGGLFRNIKLKFNLKLAAGMDEVCLAAPNDQISWDKIAHFLRIDLYDPQPRHSNTSLIFYTVYNGQVTQNFYKISFLSPCTSTSILLHYQVRVRPFMILYLLCTTCSIQYTRNFLPATSRHYDLQCNEAFKV